MSDKLLKALHETAQGLHQAGTMDAVTLREFDALCLNTSASTVQKWEQGQKRPNGPSQKLLDLVDRKGLEAMF
ncbi:transcriptional regulator-like protein [Caballeronia udeis]|uniref:Transcriptional regulator-like protein n=1 Tax=Caballeronia udeis TaxID=1232866 RepID=A0A158GAH1_9BURK|nr:hypothetical protein [Caballeronia udeis]SAL29124.1 transcriptional regulator-like protein [Caballeronia udeis]